MIIQLNKYSNDLFAGIYDLSKLSNNYVDLAIMNSTRMQAVSCLSVLDLDMFVFIVHAQIGSNDLRGILYDSGIKFDFSAQISFNINSPTINFIHDITCQEELQIGRLGFSCVITSGSGSLSEHFFELNSQSLVVRVINETKYNQYLDYSMRTVKAYKRYIVAQARSITDYQNAILVYKRKSFDGSEHLYSGISSDRFGNQDIDNIEMSLYEYNNQYKVYIQPVNSRQAFVFQLDDLKI